MTAEFYITVMVAALLLTVLVCILNGLFSGRKNNQDDTLSSGKIRSSYEEETAGDEEDDLPLTRITVYQDNGEILREVTGNFEIDDEGDTYVCYTDENDKCHSIYAMSGFIFIDEV